MSTDKILLGHITMHSLRCGLLLQLQRGLSIYLSQCWHGSPTRLAKMAELIRVLFGVETWGAQRTIHVLGGAPIPQRKGHWGQCCLLLTLLQPFAIINFVKILV